METSLHRQLKQLYAGEEGQVEVVLGSYRIDAVVGSRLVEIQHGSLAAIRDKIRELVRDHEILLVKPIVARKRIIKMTEREGEIVSRRLSPKKGSQLSLFDEMVYFTRAFPHERLTLETPLVEVEELRVPGHGRRRRWRKNDHEVLDQRLVEVISTQQYSTAADLLDVMPPGLGEQFDTAELSRGLGVDRWIAQRVAYCWRETGATVAVGKKGNSILYERAA